MRTICIIQARLRSTRLPGKVLLPLPNGRNVLQEVVHRCQQIPGVDRVVVAMPSHPDSLYLRPYTLDAHHYFGPEQDVLARYYGAACSHNADIIVRVTSDCPLIDPILCGQVIRHREQHGQAYSYNNMPTGLSRPHDLDGELGTFPQGLDCEAFTMAALEWTHENGSHKETREHVTRGLRASCQGSDQPMNPAGDYSHLRWTLDTIDDYVTICGLFSEDGDEMQELLKRFRG
jgi:spore coat polysaccharide biosynthesis protein SpsF